MSDNSSQNLLWVRNEMLPESEPPLTESGVLNWMRENLFSGPFSTVLTLVSIYTIYVILSHIVPWLWQSVWFAGSLTECREIALAAWGPDASTSCFAVITERWNQLLFGFYPRELQWRVILALLLFFVAVAPVLFAEAPRKLLWFTAIYPFLMFWLLWGGSIWPPVLVLAGFAVLYFANAGLSPIVGSLGGLILSVIAALAWWGFLVSPIANVLPAVGPFFLEPVASKEFGGFMLSVTIGVTGIVLSLPLGIILALGRQSDLMIVKTLCVGFIEFIRGVPLITLLFTASLLLNYFLPPGTSFDLVLRVIIMVTLFAAAYMAETIRGGLAALPRGQYEAADALGLDYWKAQRLIIMPQALKISIPGIVNNFIGLFKDTTLVVFIGLLDPVGFTNTIRSTTDWNGVYLELFVFIGLLFWICCFSMSRYSQYLERKLRTDHR